MVHYKRSLTTHNTSGPYNSKEYILLHHTASWYGSISWILDHLTTGPVSCHYVIDTNGDIYKIGSDTDILRHAGDSIWEGKVGMNRYSIGIEHIGPLPWFTDAQRVSSRKLILDLMQKYHIPHHHIIIHKDVSPGRKIDVDDDFWRNQYKTFVAYQQSFADFRNVIGMYETLYKKEFADTIHDGNTILKNIEDSFGYLVHVDGTLHVQELLYLSQIGTERIRQEYLFFVQYLMGKYEKIYKNEFATLIASDKVIMKDIPGAAENCLNDDGTLNLKELLYFMNIWFERIRKEMK